jgi:hypothetical protein
MKYKFIGVEPEFFPSLGRELQPNEVFESDSTIINRNVDKITGAGYVAPPVVEQPQQPTSQEVETPTEPQGVTNNG